MRHGRGRPVGGVALGRHVRPALPARLVRQALRDPARPHAGHPPRVRRRNAREPADPPRDEPAAHRALRHRRAGERARRAAREDAGPPHGRGAPPDGSLEQGLRRDDGERPLRARHAHALREHARPRARGVLLPLLRQAADPACGLGRGAADARPRLPLEGPRVRLRARLPHEQRRGQRGGAPESVRRVRRARRLVGAGAGLAPGPPLPVHGGDDARRHLRQRASRPESRLVARLGREERHPRRHDERRGLGVLPSPEGLALLRRRARLEHGVAAHPRRRLRRRDAARDDARHVLEVPGGLLAREGGRHPSALDVPQGHRRLLPLGRPSRLRLRRPGEERVPRTADAQEGCAEARPLAVQPLVREARRPRVVRAAVGRGLGVAEGGREGRRRLRPVPVRGLRDDGLHLHGRGRPGRAARAAARRRLGAREGARGREGRLRALRLRPNASGVPREARRQDRHL